MSEKNYETSELKELKDALQTFTEFVWEMEEYLPEFYHFFDAMRQNIEIFLQVGEEDEEQIHEILERDWEKAHAPLVGVQCYDFQESHPEAEAGTCVYFANLLTEIGRHGKRHLQGHKGGHRVPFCVPALRKGGTDMASFLEDITPFYGTGERNGKGQTLEEFLEEYDPYRYKNPCCTTDTVVFSYKDEQALKEGRLKILLVKRGNHPSIGCWALPGGFVNLRENLEDTARRELQEETGVSGLPVEQFACYGDYQRDPRARIITSAYLSIVKESDVSVEAGDDAADASWFEIEMEPETVYEEDGWEKTEYHLTIQNQDQKMNAVVQKKERTGLVREKYYVVKEGGGIAVDHAAILAQAYELLKGRL